jgi:hypothetical protein
MNTRWLLLGLTLPVLVLSGCASTGAGGCTQKQLPALLASTDFAALLGPVAGQLCEATCTPAGGGRVTCDAPLRNQPMPWLVPDFVDLNSFTPGATGLYLGEQMRATLSHQCGAPIRQIEFGKHIQLTENGQVSLTRNPDQILQNEVAGQDIVVGTYTFNAGRLSLFVRRVDATTGVITRMVAKEISYSCGTLGNRVAQVD